MGSDNNIDIWKKVIFNLPSTRKDSHRNSCLRTSLQRTSLSRFRFFTPLSLPGSTILFIAIFLFILPTAASAELLHRFIPDYPRKWGYFLAFCNQNILFAYSMILTGANNFLNAWNILWLAIITVYLSNFFFLLMLTIGYDHLKKSACSASHSRF